VVLGLNLEEHCSQHQSTSSERRRRKKIAYKYFGVAVRVSFLASVEQEIYHAFKFITVFIYNFRFESPYWLTGEW